MLLKLEPLLKFWKDYSRAGHHKVRSVPFYLVFSTRTNSQLYFVSIQEPTCISSIEKQRPIGIVTIFCRNLLKHLGRIFSHF